MTDRPTPEEIAGKFDATPGLDTPASLYLGALHYQGYVIVHPDDVPEHSHGYPPPTPVHSFNWCEGWNACRRRIFGDDR